MRGQINRADRTQRLVTATTLIVLNAIGLSEFTEWTRWLALGIQIELLATALAGWCPFYWSFGLSRDA
jgi:hypothetical protein